MDACCHIIRKSLSTTNELACKMRILCDEQEDERIILRLLYKELTTLIDKDVIDLLSKEPDKQVYQDEDCFEFQGDGKPLFLRDMENEVIYKSYFNILFDDIEINQIIENLL